ncbi:MAG TPA: hypothetical protein VFV95_03120 [Vicinamibacterales bacterium]|nr:hypothetical protein [Vicinamibacterales bacterium]
MRTALLLSFLTTFAVGVVAQTPSAKSPSTQTSATKTPPAQTAPAPAQTAPAQGAPAPAATPKNQQPKTPPATTGTSPQKPAPTTGRGAAANTRTGLAMTVTDMKGGPLDEVHVELTGPMMRAGDTSGGGLLNFTGLQGGTYRLRFSGEAVTALEKEIVLVGGKVNTIDVALSPAPPPKEIEKIVQVPAPAPPAEPSTKLGPIGMPQTVDLVKLIEKDGGKSPGRTLVACSGNTRSVLTQLTQDQQPLLYDNAEVALYVLGGEGTMRIGNSESKVSAGYFVSIPRNTSFVMIRRGNKALVFLSVLSGEPCEEAK